MFCSYCGGKLGQDVKFCIHCGNGISSSPTVPVSESPIPPQTPAQPIQQSPVTSPKPKKSKGRPLLFGVCGTAVGAILLAIILFATGVLSFGGKTIEGPGFATPEGAAKAYLSGLRDQDIDTMLSAFAVESYVDNYDLEYLIERIYSYAFTSEIPLPNTNEYTRQLNVESRSASITRDIIIQYMYFQTPDAFGEGKYIIFKEPETISSFVKQFERNTKNYVFEDLVITDTLKPEDLSDKYMTEESQENIARQAKTFGADADDVANIVVTFEADGQTWIFCPQAVRYNGKWYLQSVHGNLANILMMSSYTGSITPYDLENNIIININ